jgi:4-hydroxybenzoate polyprenyltransferase
MQQIDGITGRVADAPSNNWVYRVLPPWLWPYAQLARWDRPIGWQLLLWPCFWSAAMAANAAAHLGLFSGGQLIYHLVLYFIGSVAMRGAGCTYNDLVDHKIDMEVARTRSRPLPSGRVTRSQAKIFIVLQALVGLLVVLQLNWFSVILGIALAGHRRALSLRQALYRLAAILPRTGLFLGRADGLGGDLRQPLTGAGSALYRAVVWTIGYDTIYAHQDKEDDELIGVRSTARLFGDNTKPWLVGLYGLMLVLTFAAFLLAGVGLFAYLGLLIVAAGMFAWQIVTLDINDA